MLQRLAYRFSSGDGDVKSRSGLGKGDVGVTIPGRQTISRETAEAIGLLGTDCDEEEESTERWITQAAATSALAGGLASDLASGRRVWVPDDDEVWRIANVVSESADGGSYTVSNKGGAGKVQIPREECADFDPSHTLDLEDISRMNLMHEAPLLHLLRRRFQASTIYTNVADVLVSINPYVDIAGLYDIPMPGARGAQARGQDNVASELNTNSQLSALKRMLEKPHVYCVAERAFRYMADSKGREIDGRMRRRNQSILITGESGAGKTEASKHVMRFLITASRALAGTASVTTTPSNGPASAVATPAARIAASAAAAKHTEDVLMRSNTVLEAFGNAKTVRNDNSSRFGKYIKLLYDGTFRLVGARTEHFLLEKSRLVHLEEGERTYHILYQVAKALPAGQKKGLFLTGPAECFSLLSRGNCLEASDIVDDHKEFKAVDEALSSLRFSVDDKAGMWRLLAAILHSGEVRFGESLGKERGCIFQVGDAKSVSPTVLASLWGVEVAAFEAGVMRRTVTAGDTSVSVELNAAQARDNLLALLKHIYRQLFAWINWKINAVFDFPVEVEAVPTEEAGAKASEPAFIGILDIFGFEITNTNGFEQLCINFANEVLQQEFNRHIFVLEQEEYEAEGLEVESIPFRDNQAIIDLIAKRPAGLMSILEDQALTGRKAASLKASVTDRDLLDLFHQQHHRNAPHPCYRKPRFDGLDFVVMHYAADVTYCATGFLEKNNDTLHKDLREMLISSRVPFFRQLTLGQSGVFQRVPGCSDGARDGHKNDDCCYEPIPVSAARRCQQSVHGSVGDGTVTTEGHGYISCRKSSSGSPLSARERASCQCRAAGQPKDGAYISGMRISPLHDDCSDGDAEGMGDPGGGDRRGSSGAMGPPSNSPPVGRKGEGRMGEITTPNVGATARDPGWKRVTKKASSAKLAAKATVSNAFRSQLDELVAQLRETEPHYIKCIKPSYDKARGDWVSPLVIEQLRYSGILEVVRIRQEAFPMRVAYAEFYRRFSKLLASKRGLPPTDVGTPAEARFAGLKICEKVFGAEEVGSSFQTGKTKVFLRGDGLERLRAALRTHYFDLAVQMQALWRGALARAEVASRRKAVGIMQKVARGNIARRRYHASRRAVVLVQSVVRMRQAKQRLVRRKTMTAKIQAAWKGAAVARAKHMRRKEATGKLRQLAQEYITRRRQSKMRRAAVLQQTVDQIQGSTEKIVAQRHVSDAKIQKAGAGARHEGQIEKPLLNHQPKHDEPSTVHRAERTIRSCLRNKRLRTKSVQVFQAARSGDAPALVRYLMDFPMLLFLRDRHDGSIPSYVKDDSQRGSPSFSTLVHAACQSGAVEVVALLQPFLCDITAVDRWGNTPVHVAAAGCHYELLKFLGYRANLDIGEEIIQEGRAPASDEVELDPGASPPASGDGFGFQLGLAGHSEEKKAAANVTRMTRRLRMRVARGLECQHPGKADDTRVLSTLTGNDCKGEVATMSGLRVASSDRDGLVVEGFLQKRRERGRCRRRWCQVKPVSSTVGYGCGTGLALFYFKQRYAKVPSKIILLKHCFLKESEAVSCAFELYSPLLTERKNGEGRLYFQTGDESELHRWLLALRPAVKSYDFKSCNRRLPMSYLNQGRREHLVRLKNHLRQTPLHLVVVVVNRKGRSQGRACESGGGDGEGGKMFNYAAQRVADWLIENGADSKVWTENGGGSSHREMRPAGLGHKAVELHQRKGQRERPGTTSWSSPMHSLGKNVMRRLRKGGTATSSKKNVIITAAAAIVAEGIAPAVFGAAPAAALPGSVASPLFPAPDKLRGFSYLSVFVEAVNIASTTGMVEPFLTVTVRCEKGQPIEAAQMIEAPAMTMPDTLWWGRMWHMQTPFEALNAGSAVVFELWHVLEGNHKTMICWGFLPLNEDRLDTRSELLPTYLPPTSPGKASSKNHLTNVTRVDTETIATPCSSSSPPFIATSVAGREIREGATFNGEGFSSSMADATLAVDVHLTHALM